MSRRSRRSKRKLNSLFMMLLLTGMLLLSSTYAWFSANKEVALEGISAKVVAAEGLQISLDGETWSSKFTVTKSVLDGLGVKNKHAWPDALTPSSTTGESSNGNINMFAGDVSVDGTQLTNAAAVTEGSNYIVFDLYFKNSSSQTSGDTLQLNTTTNVKITDGEGKPNTGLENSVRAAVILYSNKANMTDDGDTVRGITFGTPKVCIWEPNYNKHIAEVVKNDSRIDSDTAAFTTLGLKSIGDGTVTGINADTVDGSNAYLAQQKTLQTDATIGSATDMTNLGASDDKLTLQQNSIMKARVYIWLEGQDPDCIDTASTGKSIDMVLGFTKPAVQVPGP